MSTAKEPMKRKDYDAALRELQVELCALQEWVKHKGLRVVVVFEGRDAAGKGGVIKAITERVSPRVFRVVALPAPSDREKSQLYLQRYVPHLPAAGEVVIFDRSWYNRAGVEVVMGFCTEAQHRRFLILCPEFEHVIVDDGIFLVKFWLEVSDAEQERRFEARIKDPLRQWKLSPMDLSSRGKWYEYSRARDTMLKATDTDFAPWTIVPSDDKQRARLNCIRHLLKRDSLRDRAARQDQIAQALEEGRLRRCGFAQGPAVRRGWAVGQTWSLGLRRRLASVELLSCEDDSAQDRKALNSGQSRTPQRSALPLRQISRYDTSEKAWQPKPNAADSVCVGSLPSERNCRGAAMARRGDFGWYGLDILGSKTVPASMEGWKASIEPFRLAQ